MDRIYFPSTRVAPLFGIFLKIYLFTYKKNFKNLKKKKKKKNHW